MQTGFIIGAVSFELIPGPDKIRSGVALWSDISDGADFSTPLPSTYNNAAIDNEASLFKSEHFYTVNASLNTSFNYGRLWAEIRDEQLPHALGAIASIDSHRLLSSVLQGNVTAQHLLNDEEIVNGQYIHVEANAIHTIATGIIVQTVINAQTNANETVKATRNRVVTQDDQITTTHTLASGLIRSQEVYAQTLTSHHLNAGLTTQTQLNSNITASSTIASNRVTQVTAFSGMVADSIIESIRLRVFGIIEQTITQQAIEITRGRAVYINSSIVTHPILDDIAQATVDNIDSVATTESSIASVRKRPQQIHISVNTHHYLESMWWEVKPSHWQVAPHGTDNLNGKALGGIPHLRQSIKDILMTPIGTRVMRREYGSRLFDLVDSPMNQATVIDFYAATANALRKWEPRFKLERVQADEISEGKMGLTVEGIYLPNGEQVTIEGIVI